MKKLNIILSLLFVSSALIAQEYPKLKPLSEKEMEEKLVPAQRKDKWGYANEKESFRIKAMFDMADPFVQTVVSGKDTVTSARVVYEGKYGFLDHTGVFLYNPMFDSLSEFDRGVSVFTRNGVSGFLTATGKILADGLDAMMLFDENGMAWFRKDGYWGAYDLEGNVVIPNEYDKLPDVSYGALQQVEKGGKYGLASSSEKKVVLAAECDRIAYDEKDKSLVICRKGDMYGCFSIDGKQLFPVECEEIITYEGGRIVVKKEGRFGYYDNKGTELIPPVMYTNQIAQSHDFYQLFDNAAGRQDIKVYYKDNHLDIKTFDSLLFNDMGKEKYAAEADAKTGRFPQWLKGRMAEAVPAGQYVAKWRFDGAYYPEAGAKDLPEGAGPFIAVGKDMQVVKYEGFEMPANKAMNQAVLKVDTVDVACGSWIRSLMVSVNGGKIAMYDRAMRTNVLNKWKTLTAEIRNAILAPDGDALVVVDLMVDDLLMQRVMTKMSPSGSQKFSIKMDGILYNQENFVSEEVSGCFATNDMIIVSYISGKNEDKITKFYNYNGNILTELNDFCAEVMLESSPAVKFYGRDNSSYGTCTIDFTTRSFSRFSLEQDVNRKTTRMIDGTVHFIDKETMLVDAVFDVKSKHMPVQAFRYTSSEWDGRTIVGVSPNHCSKAEDIRWTYIPRVTSGTYSENINGYMINIYPVGGDDIAVYGVYPDVWSNEGIRYGYIGYDGTFFTQAYFEEAKPFVDGVAEVKIRGEWKKLKKEDFKKYMNDPAGVLSPDNYEIGSVIFTMEHIAKSMSGTGNEVTEKGYWLTRGNGGELIAFLNTLTGKYGFVDSAGKMVVAPIYDSFHNIDPTADGLIAVRRDDGKNDKDSGWGFIDMNGEEVIPCKYYASWSPEVETLFSLGDNGVCVLAMMLSDGQKKVGCINKKGEVVVPFEYDEVSNPVGGVITARSGDVEKQFRLH